MTADEAKEIAVSAYIYAYPLVLMDVTRKVQSNSEVSDTKTGALPKGMTEIKAPTAIGWMIGRTQTDGKKDYEAVHQFQTGLKTVPLSAWGKKDWTAPKGKFDPQQDMGAPVEQVAKMSVAEFFAGFDGTWQPPAMRHVK